MNIYSTIFLGGYFVSVLSVFKKNKIFTRFYISIMVALLLVLSGLRSMNIGYDNVGHMRFYYSITSGQISISDFKEPGFALLSYIVSLFGNYNLFIFVYAIISLIILIISIKYFSITPSVTLYIYYAYYFLANNMAKIRQSMAVLILLIALKYLDKKNERLFLLFVIIASTFHASALFFIILVFLNKLDLNKRFMYLLIVVAVIIGQSGIIEFIYYNIIGNSELIRSINFLPLKRLANYASSEHTIKVGSGYLGYLYTLINSILVVWLYDRIRKISSKGEIIAKTYYWGTLLFFTMFNLALINSRLTMGFLILEIFLIPLFFRSIRNKNLRVIFVIFYLSIVLLRGYLGLLGDFEKFVPFEFFWNQ